MLTAYPPENSLAVIETFGQAVRLRWLRASHEVYLQTF